MTIPTQESLSYWRDRPRPQSSDLVLRHCLAELLQQVGAEQARSLCYAIGVRIAVENPLGGVERLSEVEVAARRFLAERDWGWIRLEEREDAVDFVHGCSPLRAWFGTAGLEWGPALFEGIYAEWLRQLGASERLELRQIDAPIGDDDLLRFRLTHESHFAG